MSADGKVKTFSVKLGDIYHAKLIDDIDGTTTDFALHVTNARVTVSPQDLQKRCVDDLALLARVVATNKHLRSLDLEARLTPRALEGLMRAVVTSTSLRKLRIALIDNPAFDAQGEILPISEFEPMLRRVFARPKQSVYKAALEQPVAAG